MVTVIAMAVGAACYAVMWTWAFHHSVSVFANKPQYSFWGSGCWERKYKNFSKPGYVPKYYKKLASGKYYMAFGIDYIERFPGSATIFVFLTDGFHLMQWIFRWCISAACLPTEILDEQWWVIAGFVIAIRVAWYIPFNIMFKLLKRK